MTDCPNAGYRMCAYKDRLPPRADAWLWEEKISPFSRTGGFRKWGPESSQLIAASLVALSAREHRLGGHRHGAAVFRVCDR